MKTLLAVLLLSALSYGQTNATQDATALEAQYGTCAKHSIPADKCTPEIYDQLKAKDNAPLDATTATVVRAVKEYQSRLKNPASMQVQTVYITEKADICLEIGGQNGAGGMSVARIVYTSKGKWLDEGGFGGAAAANVQSGYTVDRWRGACYKAKFIGQGPMFPGTDVTAKVNQALKRVSQE